MFSISLASSIVELPAPVAVCCHDAGGANLVAAWVADDPLRHYRICAEGPARKIFAAIVPDRITVPRADLLDGAACLLSGTGWGSSLEHDARTAAALRGIPVLAVLDHWVNYRMRFTRGEVEILPDAFVVTDQDAAHLALETFGGGRPILSWENRYLQREAANVRKYTERSSAIAPRRLLVLLEPVRRDWIANADRPAEFRALDYLMGNLAAIFPSTNDTVIRLRPHPSEPQAKYLPWLHGQTHAGLSITDGTTLSEDIAWADVAAGLESYALVVALESGRRAVSYIPPGGPKCALRHGGLQHLAGLIGNAT